LSGEEYEFGRRSLIWRKWIYDNNGFCQSRKLWM